VRKLAGGEI